MVQKILLSQDPELLPKITKRKTLTIPLRAGNSWWDSSHKWNADHISVQPYLVINEVRFTLLSSHILGAPQLDSWPSQVLRTQNKTNKKGNSCPWKKKDQQPVGTWKQIHESQFTDLIFTNVCPANLNLKRKECEILPSSFDRTLQIERSGGADFGKDSHSLLASTSFPRILSAGSGVHRVSQWVSSWSPETLEEEK